MVRFVSALIAFRKKNPILRKTHFLKSNDIEWHGHMPLHPDWKVHSRFIAFTLNDEHHPIYAAFNADYHPARVILPGLSDGKKWHLLVNSAEPWDRQMIESPENGADPGPSIEMHPYSALLLQG